MRKTFILLLFLTCCFQAFSTNYYFSITGSDLNDGKSKSTPWLSFNKLETVLINPGDSILFKSGETFSSNYNIHLYKWIATGADGIYGTGDDIAYGNVLSSSSINPIVITTYPANGTPAIIKFTKDTTGIDLYNVQGIKILNLTLTGVGIGAKPKYIGISVFNEDSYGAPLTDTLKNYLIQNVNVSGFQTGILIGSWGERHTAGISVIQTESHDNFIDGISTSAQQAGFVSDLIFRYCKMYGNSGDPTGYTSSGNGLLIADATNVLVEKCIAYNNGYSYTANVNSAGIWTLNSKQVIIQNCESYQNKTAGPAGGGGFQLDGGSQQCTIQYCYSHGNDGSGFFIWQSSGARAFNNNLLRYNISQNDGGKNGTGSIHFYSSGSNGGLTSTEIYNNTIYNNTSSAVKFQVTTGISGVKIRNNIFQTDASKALIIGNPATSAAKFENNAYWSNGATFSFAGYSNIASWRTATNQEMKGATALGINMDPALNNPGNGGIINNADYLDTLSAYKLKLSSPLLNAAENLTLAENGSVITGTHDFYNNSLPYKNSYDIGAHEYSDVWPSISGSPNKIYLEGLTNSIATLNISSNVAHKITFYASWLSANVTTGSGNQTITFKALQDNMDGLDKVTTVIISKTDGSIASSDTVQVIQKSAYTILFNLTTIDNLPVKGATVKIGGNTITTDINGRASIMLINGNYSYTISKPGFEPVEETPFIVSNANLAFQIKMTSVKYKVIFYINDGLSSIAGAAITVQTTTNYSSGAGYATMILETGTYSYNITKIGFYTIPNTSFLITKDTTISVTLIPIPPSVYNVKFKLYDDDIDTVLVNVSIKIDTTIITTSASGEATFNLVNGNYKYTISKLGYDSIVNASLKVSGKDTTIIIHLLEVGFPITFVVTDGTIPVEGAIVKVDTQSVKTDLEGKAVLMLMDGNYSFTVSKEGYISVAATPFTVKDEHKTIPVTINKNLGWTSALTEIEAYPNPVTENLFVRGLANKETLELCTTTGVVVFKIKPSGNDSENIDMTGLAPGIYILKIVSSQGTDSRIIMKAE